MACRHALPLELASDAVLGDGEVGYAPFDGAGRAAEYEAAVDHRHRGGHLERHRVGGAWSS